MATVQDILDELRAVARPDQIPGMERYGMAAPGRLGVSVPEMRRIGKRAGKDHALALQLWQTGIPEARIVAALVADPKQLTAAQMDAWAQDFNVWDVCDQVCLNLFDKSPLAWRKAAEWSAREEEFVRRAAYALIACLAWHDKKAKDEQFISLLPVIVQGATDNRNFVKKAVSWALRKIGNRNRTLNQAAIATAQQIQALEGKAARWVAADVLRELQSETVQKRLPS